MWLLEKPKATTCMILRLTSLVIFMALPQTDALKTNMHRFCKHLKQLSPRNA